MDKGAAKSDVLDRYDQALEDILSLRSQTSVTKTVAPAVVDRQTSVSLKARIYEAEERVSTLLDEIDSHLGAVQEPAQIPGPAEQAVVSLPDEPVIIPLADPVSVYVHPQRTLKDDLVDQLGTSWISYLAYSSPSKLLAKNDASELMHTFQATLGNFKNPTLTNLFDENPEIQTWLAVHPQIEDASEVAEFIISNFPPLEAVESLQVLMQLFLEE